MPDQPVSADPIAEMDARHAAIKREEAERAVIRNREDAARTEQAIREYNSSEPALARLQQLHSEMLMRMDSRESQEYMAEHGAQHPLVLAAMSGEDHWSPDAGELKELFDAASPEDQAAFKKSLKG